MAAAIINLAREQKGKNLDQTLEEVARYLYERQALGSWREIVRSIDILWRKEYGHSRLEIKSAYPLSAKLRKQIQILAPQAVLNESVDPALLGGIAVRVDDTIYDGTLLSQLENMRQTLVNNTL